MYPDFSGEPADLQEFIASDLIDVSIKSNLEKNSERMEGGGAGEECEG